MTENGYANAVLVTTDWLAEHLGDADLVVAEVDENPDLYEEGHIPGAVKLDTMPRLFPNAAVVWTRTSGPFSVDRCPSTSPRSLIALVELRSPARLNRPSDHTHPPGASSRVPTI